LKELFFYKSKYEKLKHGLFFILSAAPPKQGGNINFIRKISLYKSLLEKGGYRGIFCSLTNPPNPFAKGGIFSPPLLWCVVLSAAAVSFASIK
jgi:hypothetical protein